MDFDVIYRITLASSYNELISSFEKFLENNGVKYYGYQEVNLQNPEYSKIISNYPSGWLEEYVAQHYHNIDPVMLTLGHFRGLFSWNKTRKIITGQTYNRYWHSASTYGITKGAATALSKSSSFSSGIGFCIDDKSEQDWINAFAGLISVTSYAFEQKLKVLANESIIKSANFSCRELECLRWLVDGLSHSDIGEKVNLSERTVRFHLNSLRQKLRCNSREQLIAKAVSLGVVNPS